MKKTYKHNKNSKKKTKNLIINLSLLISAVLIFFAVFEITARIFNLYPEYGTTKGLFVKDNVLDYSMAPNFKSTFVRQEFKVDISTNSLGLRDVEYGEKKSNDLRILALGDSFTWGAYGTDLNETFLKLLERKLNSNKKFNYQVINSGVPGYGTDQQLLYLMDRGINLKLDIVMLNFFVGNDFEDNTQSNEMTVSDGTLVTNKLRRSFQERARAFTLLHFHSYRIIEKGMINIFSNFIDKYIRKSFQQDAYQAQLFLEKPSPEIKEQFEKTKEILENMKDYARKNNIELVIVIIPLKYQVDEELKQTFIKNNYKNETIDVELPQKIIRQWAAENNVVVIDLLPELAKQNKKNDFYWKLNPHFNKKGNEEVASIIYNELKNSNVIK